MQSVAMVKLDYFFEITSSNKIKLTTNKRAKKHELTRDNAISTNLALGVVFDLSDLLETGAKM